jgi:hypothetical protein
MGEFERSDCFQIVHVEAQHPYGDSRDGLHGQPSATLLIFGSAGLCVVYGRGEIKVATTFWCDYTQSAKSTTPVSPLLCSNYQQTWYMLTATWQPGAVSAQYAQNWTNRPDKQGYNNAAIIAGCSQW